MDVLCMEEAKKGVQTLFPVMEHLKDIFEEFGVIELEGRVKAVALGALKLLLDLQEWSETVGCRAAYIWGVDMHLYSNLTPPEWKGKVIWPSEFELLWQLWNSVDSNVIEICDKTPPEVRRGETDDSLEFIFSKVRDTLVQRIADLEEVTSLLRKEIEEQNAAAVQKAEKALKQFSFDNRILVAGEQAKLLFLKLAGRIDDVQIAVVKEGEEDLDEIQTLSNDLQELVQATKLQLDSFASLVLLMVSSKSKKLNSGNSSPSPKLEEEVGDNLIVDAGGKTPVGRAERKEFTNECSESSDSETGSFESLGDDEFFECRGNLGGKLEEEFEIDNEKDFAEKSFRNVMVELQNKLTDRREVMAAREAKARKRVVDDGSSTNSSDAEDTENVNSSDSKIDPLFKNGNREDHLSNQDSTAFRLPTTFNSELQKALSRMTVVPTKEELYCDSDTE